jgi:hypothetical protein
LPPRVLSALGFEQSIRLRHQGCYEEVRVPIAHLGKAGAIAFAESQGSRDRTSSRTNESGNEPGVAARPGLAFPIRKLRDNFTVRNGLKYPQWQEPLAAAILEFDPQRLREKVQRAEAAIVDRLEELATEQGNQLERLALFDALSILKRVKKDRLGILDPQRE